MVRELTDIEKAIRRIADTEDGKQLFKHLKKHKVNRALMPNSVGDGQALAMIMAFKDGEANVVRELINIVEKD